MERFYSALLKINRAKQHIMDLRAEFDAFLNANPHTYAVKYEYDRDAYSQMQDLRISVEFEKNVCVPEIFGLLIGDAAHNLRSALDHLMWELIGPVNGPQDKRLTFPMADIRTNYDSAIDGLQATPAATKKFLKCFEAYSRGNGKALYGLHILDRTDKHRVINPIVAAARISGLRDHREQTVYPDISARIGENGEAIFPINFRAIPSEGQRDFKVTLDVFFSNVEFFPGKPVLPALVELTDHVIDVREAFVDLVNNRP